MTSLSRFCPGVKIGVIGYNGAGKSTLLRIMAGLEKEFNGEAWIADGATAGYLPQEPQLDPRKSVEENVLEGLGPIKAIVDRFEAVSQLLGEVVDVDEMTALIDEQAALQEQIDSADAWDLSRTVEMAMEALRCPPPDTEVSKLSGGEARRVALARLLLQNRICYCSMSRQIISTLNRSPGSSGTFVSIRVRSLW